MALPPCTVVAETAHLSVGHGVAIVSLEARVRAPGSDAAGAPRTGCIVDAGAVLRAREEGRAPPELVAWRAEIDGRAAALGGPRGRVAVELHLHRERRVRFVAVLRGDRFAAVPLSTEPAALSKPVVFRATTDSVWGPHRIAGLARWTDTGTPIVVTVDPTRDREPPSASETVVPHTAVPVLVVDAGPRLAGEPSLESEDSRTAALGRGGVEAVSVLLGDLPLAIATAPDAETAIARLREAARAARAAAGASDPLYAAIGQRLATALSTGFATCARGPTLALPARWPTAAPELVSTGLFSDPESGCPKIADLLAVNHPEVRLGQEAGAALADAAALRALPRLGPLEKRLDSRPKTRRGARPIAAVAAATLVALAAAAVFLSRSGEARYSR